MLKEITVAVIIVTAILTLQTIYLAVGAVNFCILMCVSTLVAGIFRLFQMSWELAFFICFVVGPQLGWLIGYYL